MGLFSAFIKTGKDHIGIDIGSHSVKTVELVKEKDIFRIKNMGYARVKKANSAESLLEAISESVSMAKIAPNKDVNVAISGSSVVVRFIELPRMNEDELKNAIIFEAEKYIPFSVNDVIIDHQLIIPHLADNKMLVLLIAAKKDVINERLEIINKAGLSVNIIDVVSLAGVNAFLTTAGRKKDEVAAIINVGAKGTDISIVSDDTLYFTRSVQIGGNDLTKALSDSLSLGQKEAEELKVNPGERAREVSECVKTVLYTIADEIRLSFSYYENQSGRNIGRIYLSGGTAKGMNIGDILHERLDVDVELWEPSVSMAMESPIKKELADSLKYQMSTAIGLALRR
ncbi:MAG: type IV pilus assembly protein PilM [Candidatus Omnitrophica bacterium]|nr:type IV pilus assembly protein PilM [Candidatus Omnitrophota bacterium]MBU4488004.1 type IV pilus assembly protein PilM [Candidatus Omnitrophota bacterium]MCG2704754.1 type IV pilus assembly protein PilM [Candidatus Omnitrophota bacterium]